MLSSNWCRFVLNEGVMPASLARLIKHDETNLKNTKLLAQILQQRESFTNNEYIEITNIAKTAFLNDNELINWLISMDSILTIIITFADADNNTKDILNGALTSFIKSCPLVSEQVKNSYISLPFSSVSLNSPAQKYSSRNYSKSVLDAKKEDFVEYLDKFAPKHYSTSTASSYKTSVNLGLIYAGRNLWEIDNPQELKSILDELNTRDDFKEKNKNTNNSLSNGLWRYLEFLEYRAKQG